MRKQADRVEPPLGPYKEIWTANDRDGVERRRFLYSKGEEYAKSCELWRDEEYVRQGCR